MVFLARTPSITKLLRFATSVRHLMASRADHSKITEHPLRIENLTFQRNFIYIFFFFSPGVHYDFSGVQKQ